MNNPTPDVLGDLLTTVEAAQLLHMKVDRLRDWRGKGYGPRSFRLGGSVMYRRTEINDWIAEQIEAQQ